MQRQGKFGSRKEQKGTRRKKGAGQETGGENREKIGSKAGKDREGKKRRKRAMWERRESNVNKNIEGEKIRKVWKIWMGSRRTIGKWRTRKEG